MSAIERPYRLPRVSGRFSSQATRHRRLNPYAVASAIVVLVLWETLSFVLGKSSTGYRTVPGIQDVLGAYRLFAGYWKGGLGAPSTLSGAHPTLWGATLGMLYNAGVSLWRVAIGYALGVSVGVGVALVISWSPFARESLSFLAHLARMLPLLAMLPLFALWFGNSELGTVVFVAFTVAILLFAITLNAISNVPTYYAQSARALGATRVRTYLTVVFPATLPRLRGGLVLAVGFSWSAVLAAELLGKDYGLGHILGFALYYASTNLIGLTGVIVVVISALSYFGMNQVVTWITRWAE